MQETVLKRDMLSRAPASHKQGNDNDSMNTVHDFQFPVQQPQSNVILDNTVPENRLRVTVLGTVVIYLLWAYLLWLTMTELDVGMIFANSCHSSSDS